MAINTDRTVAALGEPLDLTGEDDDPVPFLVTGILVEGEPCVLGGPYKGLKSGLALDLAISLATGTPFLGSFAVPEVRRVTVFSGEPGGQAIMRTVRNICRARGVVPPGKDWLRIYPSVPAVSVVESELRAHPADVVILDPLYLLLDGTHATNLYDMGQQLAGLGSRCLAQGATPVLVHHASETLTPGKPADLSALVYSGIKQYPRQWILLNRRVPYSVERPNHHRLWFVAGGSAGHAEFAGVTVEEGRDRDRWEVEVMEPDAARTADGGGKGGSDEPGPAMKQAVRGGKVGKQPVPAASSRRWLSQPGEAS